MPGRYANRPCPHGCGTHTWYRSGTWDEWSEVGEMFVVHECAAIKRIAEDRNRAILAAIAPAWNEGLKNWDERYGG